MAARSLASWSSITQQAATTGTRASRTTPTEPKAFAPRTCPVAKARAKTRTAVVTRQERIT